MPQDADPGFSKKVPVKARLEVRIDGGSSRRNRLLHHWSNEMDQKPADKPEPKVIFRAWITLKNGKRLYAHQVGLKAFPIKVKPDKAK